ncbi:MAG: glycosyltransferase family 4 protein [Solirubrobacterales bacterium]
MSSGPSHVGLNLAFLTPGAVGGMEIYARGLIPALRRGSPSMRLTAFVHKQAFPELRDSPWLEGVDVHSLSVGPSRVGWVLGDQLAVPRAARRAGVELLHSLASTGPAVPRLPSVVTVHDLIYRHHPDAHSLLLRQGMRVLVPLAARRADRVIAISQATARDLQQSGIDPQRIDIVPNGGGKGPAAAPLPETEVRSRLRLGDRPLVLSPSAKRPHKNLIRLLDAVAGMDGEPKPTVVIPGYPTPHEQELRSHAVALGISDRVHLPGWVDDATMEGLYATAQCVVFPSLYEGFGLPVLEAMARGVPVACSNRSSLPEVAGDAALLFDPEDSVAIGAAIERLLRDDETTRSLAAAGPIQAATFTWERSAACVLASYAKAVAR